MNTDPTAWDSGRWWALACISWTTPSDVAAGLPAGGSDSDQRTSRHPTKIVREFFGLLKVERRQAGTPVATSPRQSAGELARARVHRHPLLDSQRTLGASAPSLQNLSRVHLDGFRGQTFIPFPRSLTYAHKCA